MCGFSNTPTVQLKVGVVGGGAGEEGGVSGVIEGLNRSVSKPVNNVQSGRHQSPSPGGSTCMGHFYHLFIHQKAHNTPETASSFGVVFMW